jgi:broad specificity phosphatase PhoE
MSDLLFIRHAETDMAGTFCGHSDPPVNERGLGQLQKLIAEFRHPPIDAIFSSDLQRASSTARALATPLNLAITLNSRLREIHFGEWEGLTWREIEQRDSVYAKLWTEHYLELTPPGGEDFEKFRARVLNEIAVLSKKTKYKRAAIVTHAGVMRVVLRDLCGFDEQSTWERTKQYCCSFVYVPNEGLREERL